MVHLIFKHIRTPVVIHPVVSHYPQTLTGAVMITMVIVPSVTAISKDVAPQTMVERSIVKVDIFVDMLVSMHPTVLSRPALLHMEVLLLCAMRVIAICHPASLGITKLHLEAGMRYISIKMTKMIMEN